MRPVQRLASWRLAHISVPSNMSPGHSYTLTGIQINGVSQAVGYGDDAGMATNYPIVRGTRVMVFIEPGHPHHAESIALLACGLASRIAVAAKEQHMRLKKVAASQWRRWASA
jgi:hypothetical protein